MSASSIDANVASIIVAITLLVSSIVALVVVSRLNRKLMLIISMLGMAVCHVVLAVCFYYNEQVSKYAIAVVVPVVVVVATVV
jgi:hypothetical protein